MTHRLRSILGFVFSVGFAFLANVVSAQQVPYAKWQHAGSLFILTTPDGADLPESAEVQNFPLLIKLTADTFKFNQAQRHGEDIRFASMDGTPFQYQIESWDAVLGEACVWVLIPKIVGNARQEIKMHWGNADAAPESAGSKVFSQTNGFLSVWHMGDDVVDEVGTLPSEDVKTTPVAGVIGKARYLSGGEGIFCGDKIESYPSAGMPHSTSVWFQAERPNSTIIGWGNEGGGRGSKVRMQFRSPPHLHIDSDFSDVDAPQRLPMRKWIHVVHTYADGEGRIYLDGKLAASDKMKLDIRTPGRLWIGGWYNNYDFVGTIDEVSVSNVARSPDWIKMQFENQKPNQTLVGSLVQPGNDFALSPKKLVIKENEKVTITANAGGAQKLYWIVNRDGTETTVATDRLAFTFDAGRVTGTEQATVQLRAVYANEVKVSDVAVTITDDVPEPRFRLVAPQTWNGRDQIEVVPQIENMAELKASGTSALNYEWSLDGIAVIKQTHSDKLLLKRALNSGTVTVSVAIDNGGEKTIQSVPIVVAEPSNDAWVYENPKPNFRPEDKQFFARNDKNEGTLTYSGTLNDKVDSVFVRLYADDKLVKTASQDIRPDNSYAVSVKLAAGLVHYRTEFGTSSNGRETLLHTASDLVCGDAFLIIGQSNAVATDFGPGELPPVNDWVRTFGATDTGPGGARLQLWAPATARADGGKSEIGYWGMELGRRLVERQSMPICIINGAVGGTRIDQHQRNESDPTDVRTIYGRMLWRVQEAGLTHGVRGVIWHQGENDQGADGPTGGFGWETYRRFFHELAGSWYQDYPNIQSLYLFQIWPKSCSMGVDGSDNMLREVQRTLPRDFAKLGVMSTLGIEPPGGCHFPAAGYAEFARLLEPLIERDLYGKAFEQSITPPNLLHAAYDTQLQDQIELVFDQPVVWDPNLTDQFFLDDQSNQVESGTVEGNSLILRLKEPSVAKTLTYLDSKSWSQDRLLRGVNGLAALTFCKVGLEERN